MRGREGGRPSVSESHMRVLRGDFPQENPYLCRKDLNILPVKTQATQSYPVT